MCGRIVTKHENRGSTVIENYRSVAAQNHLWEDLGATERQKASASWTINPRDQTPGMIVQQINFTFVMFMKKSAEQRFSIVQK